MRLIDADDLREEWLRGGLNEKVYDTNDFLGSIDASPTIDATPVIHAKWESVGSGYNWHYECSRCHWKDGYPFDDRHKICPSCGALMDEEVLNIDSRLA